MSERFLPMSIDESDFRLLSLANDKGKLALQLGMSDAGAQAALERCQEQRRLELIDVTTIAGAPGVFRVFRLTEAGFQRLATLGRRFARQRAP